MKIEAIGIIGANSIGTGIAEMMINKEHQVRMYDIFKDSLKAAMSKIEWALGKSGKRELMANLELIQDMSKFEGADIIIEATSGTDEERQKLLKKLAGIVRPSCILAVSAGVSPVSPLAFDIPNPERFIGLHFLAPVRKTRLVELVRTDRTGDEVLEACINLAKELGKTPVAIKDNPGAIVERLLRPFILSGIKLLEMGKGLPNEIDGAVKKVGGIPVGPLEMADSIGIDRCLSAGETIYGLLGKPERLMPANVENRLVQYGQLGKKTTAGFYLYEDGELVGENPNLGSIVRYLGIKSLPQEEIFGEIMRPVIEESKLLASEVMASELDIERTAKLGLGWPKGPFTYLRENESLLGGKKRIRSTEWD